MMTKTKKAIRRTKNAKISHAEQKVSSPLLKAANSVRCDRAHRDEVEGVEDYTRGLRDNQLIWSIPPALARGTTFGTEVSATPDKRITTPSDRSLLIHGSSVRSLQSNSASSSSVFDAWSSVEDLKISKTWRRDDLVHSSSLASYCSTAHDDDEADDNGDTKHDQSHGQPTETKCAVPCSVATSEPKVAKKLLYFFLRRHRVKSLTGTICPSASSLSEKVVESFVGAANTTKKTKRIRMVRKRTTTTDKKQNNQRGHSDDARKDPNTAIGADIMHLAGP